MRFAVLMRGILRGMGREERCELLATKNLFAEDGKPSYSHCAIIEAPADMPDGEYEIEFSGEVAYTRRFNGYWTVGQTLPHTPDEINSFIHDREGRYSGISNGTFAAPSRQSQTVNTNSRISRQDYPETEAV